MSRDGLRAASCELRVRSVARLVVALTFCLSALSAANVDQAVIDNPREANLERASTIRWESLFKPNPPWPGRQLAYLENREGERALTLLLARLLYRGEPWRRRATDVVNDQRWRRDSLETRLMVLRSLRNYRDGVVADNLCRFLAVEEHPLLVMSALTGLALIDLPTAQTWALRLADPRPATHLPGSASAQARQGALAFLVQTRGVESAQTRQALDWALLRAGGSERNHALGLLAPGTANDLLATLVLKLCAEHRNGVLDDEGKRGLVLAVTRLTGSAERDLVVALMGLTVRGERSLAMAASTALVTNLQWDAAVAINDLASRARDASDPVLRNALLAFLMRLYPQAVMEVAPVTSPWATLAEHQARLQAWQEQRAKR